MLCPSFFETDVTFLNYTFLTGMALLKIYFEVAAAQLKKIGPETLNWPSSLL